MGETYIPAARVGEVAPGSMKRVDFSGRRVLLTTVDGGYVAFPGECPHEGAELDLADITDNTLCCPNHGYQYDLHSGDCVMPVSAAALVILPIEQRGEEICIRIEW